MVDISSLITILTTDRNAMNSRRIVYIASFQNNGMFFSSTEEKLSSTGNQSWLNVTQLNVLWLNVLVK